MDSSRKNRYQLLSEISRDLLDEIYGNEENFIKGEYLDNYEIPSNAISPRTSNKISGIHPLEDYIVSYDQSMEDEGILINLGERIGFNLYYDETDAYPTAVQFYDRCSYTSRNNTSFKINKIMNMTKEDYNTFIRTLGFKYTEE